MAHVDCVNNFENDPKVAVGCKDENDGGPPSKKLRQARLPFKPLEQKPQIVSPQGPKKRKLSDGESPSAKLHKNHKQERQPSGDSKPLAPCIVDHDPEVSSSSEAENIPVGFPNRIRNTLERFVRKGPQEEISSTNDCIDIVEKNDEDAEKQEKTSCISNDLDDSEKKLPDQENTKGSDKDSSNKEQEGSDKDSSNKEQEMSINDVSISCTPEIEMTKDESKVEPKEDVSEVQSESQEVVSIEEDVSKNDSKDILSEDASTKETNDVSMDEEDVSSSEDVKLNTPAKTNKLAASPLKTPKAEVNQASSASPTSTPAESPVCPQTPGLDSPESGSDGTKAVRSKLSAAKKKEKETLRQKVKEEREKKLEEKRLKKEEERLEREEKKKERDEAKALKEKQKEEEKEKKEKERQEKLLMKEEEKKKKQEQNEAKLEEKKKKDEELKLKKEEKQREEEEKEKKASKTKQAFQSFFINKQRVSPVSKVNETNSLFMPFEVKKDMKLAPFCPRKQLDIEAAATLDQLSFQQSSDSALYLDELRKGKIRPKKYTAVDRKIDMVDDDVMLVHDEEVVKKVTYHCKLLQFHTNYRPPYYGTWRKNSKFVSPRNPWKQDKDVFDYEVESDDEWEEEEPGESLSGSEGEEEEEGADGEEEDDWMVPHGYLSDDEGCQADEDVSPEMMKAARQAKLESWESELKRQTKAALPIIVGCVWQQAVHSLQKQVQETINSYQAVCLSTDPIPTTFSGGIYSKLDGSPSDKNCATPKNGMRKPVPEEAMPDLIRLVHGNLAGIKKLIKKFRVFWGQKISGEPTPSTPTESKMEVDTNEVKDEETHNEKTAMDTSEIIEDVNTYCISKRQLELKISAIAVREKRATYKKVCWYVHENFLEQYKLTDLPVPNLQDTDIEAPKPKSEEQTTPTPLLKTPKVSITQFARPMSPSEIAAQHAAVAAKQAAEASARLAALEAASKQAAIEAAAKQQAMEAAMRQAAAVNATQLGNMTVIPGASFTSPQHRPNVNFLSPSHPNFGKVTSPKVVLPGGSLTPKSSMENQRKRITPTMLSPLLQKSLQSSPMGKNESPIRRVPAMVSPSNSQKKVTPSKISSDNQQKRIVPTTVSPLQTKAVPKTDSPFNIVSVKPINKPNVKPQGHSEPVKSPSSLQSPVRQPVKIGPVKPINQVMKIVGEGHDLENAIVID
ncbi:LOW QUALITY PROTEIN: chromatin assembly factor 1 subunit A-like [Pecten maximus]|uniref:LOW QUALITY PROTEIN: chromatin assembly factor 1 subunit A-like n=1 Tax=Pecten maximus TaxID=6579 RepID=UPI0014581D99|nr:LOW QUALITY PROTEIN: chromatin assembly factor 1 subunit A-like [Pecten maximus]